MAAKKTTKKTTAKIDDMRVLAWRVTQAQFDALTAACAKADVYKTDLLMEGLALALAKRGEKTAAKLFTPEKEQPAG